MREKVTVFILRGQPIHNAHMHLIRKALKISDLVICILGSWNVPVYLKNPWIYGQRNKMLFSSLTTEEMNKVVTIPQRDFMYSNVTWLTNVQHNVRRVIQEKLLNNPEISLIGHFKDNSSEYLKHFPQWKLIEEGNFENINGTDIRNALYENSTIDSIKNKVPDKVASILQEWLITDEFKLLKEEHEYIKQYKAQFAGYPYPPTFQTADSVVIQSGHILLIERKINPGKNMFAIPGGFVGQNEFIVDAAIRELKEETGIVSSTGKCLVKEYLKEHITDSHVFDHPYRSLRGRIITTAHLIRLKDDGPLPNVKGNDDASDAFWLPLADIRLYENRFFEDHLHIVEYFCNKL